MVDNSIQNVLPRLAAMVALAGIAALVESPLASTPRARWLRSVTLVLLFGTALSGMLLGPLGPAASRERRARIADAAVCVETVSAVLACATDHDLRRVW